jgi:hypothetical protein
MATPWQIPQRVGISNFSKITYLSEWWKYKITSDSSPEGIDPPLEELPEGIGIFSRNILIMVGPKKGHIVDPRLGATRNFLTRQLPFCSFQILSSRSIVEWNFVLSCMRLFVKWRSVHQDYMQRAERPYPVSFMDVCFPLVIVDLQLWLKIQDMKHLECSVFLVCECWRSNWTWNSLWLAASERRLAIFLPGSEGQMDPKFFFCKLGSGLAGFASGSKLSFFRLTNKKH